MAKINKIIHLDFNKIKRITGFDDGSDIEIEMEDGYYLYLYDIVMLYNKLKNKNVELKSGIEIMEKYYRDRYGEF